MAPKYIISICGYAIDADPAGSALNLALSHNETISTTQILVWARFAVLQQQKLFVSYWVIKGRNRLNVETFSSDDITIFPATTTIPFCTSCLQIVGMT